MMEGFIKWLYLSPSKWSETNNMDISNEVFNLLISFIYSTNDIELMIPEDDLRIQFYNFLYNLNKNCEIKYDIIDDQYFFFKYNESFVDVFIDMKNIMESQNSDLFLKCSADDLMNFSNQFMYVSDDSYEEDNDVYINDDIYF